MNYTAILEALGQASLFQLFRLNAAISNQLDDPTRIAAVKRVLRVGQTVRWFDSTENRLVVVKLNPKSASIQVDAMRWRVGYGLLLPVIDGALGDATYALPGQRVAITEEETRGDASSLPRQASFFDTDGEDDSEFA